jgi:L-ribulose-5-phosphate 4-epimerase
MLLPELRAQVLACARQMAADGLAHGAQGNVSALDRDSGLIAVTPSAADYATMTAEDIVIVDAAGAIVEGRWKPTIETPLHTLFYRRRPDVGAVIHCHAPYVSGFAAALRPVPVVLLETACCVGRAIPCAPTMRSGTPAFAELMLDTIGAGTAAVMGQHGLVACGANLKRAYGTAVAVEDSARACILARQLGVESAPLAPELCDELHQWWLSSYRQTPAADASSL